MFVDNKPQRKSELSEVLSNIINEGGLVPARLPSILGRMQFADMQLSGRLGKLAMADVREMGTESKVFVSLSDEVKAALAALRMRVQEGRPRVLRIQPTQKPFVLFTDGAFEPTRTVTTGSMGLATIGGVLFTPCGENRVFGCNVDSSLLDNWLDEFKHPIGLIELYAIVIAFRLWGPLLERQKVLIFGDNWAANDVFIKGTSSVKAWRTLLLEIEKLDDAIGALTWMARVPSSSNIADPPSRGSLDELKAFKPKIETHIQCPVTKNTSLMFSLKAEANEGIYQKPKICNSW